MRPALGTVLNGQQCPRWRGQVSWVRAGCVLALALFGSFGSINRASAFNGNCEIEIVRLNFAIKPNAVTKSVRIITSQIWYEIFWKSLGIPSGLNVIWIGSPLGQFQHDSGLMGSLRESKIIENTANDSEKVGFVVGHVACPLNSQFHFIRICPSKRCGEWLVCRENGILGLQYRADGMDSVLFDGTAKFSLAGLQVESECDSGVNSWLECGRFPHIFKSEQQSDAAADFIFLPIEFERTNSFDERYLNPRSLIGAHCIQLALHKGAC
jgi:hypothetical protein